MIDEDDGGGTNCMSPTQYLFTIENYDDDDEDDR